MRADPDYVEIVREGHFMRRETWERHRHLFPVYGDTQRALEARHAEQVKANFAAGVARRLERARTLLND